MNENMDLVRSVPVRALRYLGIYFNFHNTFRKKVLRYLRLHARAGGFLLSSLKYCPGNNTMAFCKNNKILLIKESLKIIMIVPCALRSCVIRPFPKVNFPWAGIRGAEILRNVGEQ